MNKNAIEDSFARVGYHQDAEYAVNEQIKWVFRNLRFTPLADVVQ